MVKKYGELTFVLISQRYNNCITSSHGEQRKTYIVYGSKPTVTKKPLLYLYICVCCEDSSSAGNTSHTSLHTHSSSQCRDMNTLNTYAHKQTSSWQSVCSHVSLIHIWVWHQTHSPLQQMEQELTGKGKDEELPCFWLMPDNLKLLETEEQFGRE